MTLVVFNKLFEQYEEGKSYILERSLANRLCEKKIAVPFTVHQEMLREKEEAEKKEKAEAEKKAELLKQKKRNLKKLNQKNRNKQKEQLKITLNKGG